MVVVTMKRHKMVNLCPTTFEIASKMPNFSKWVRQALLETDERNTFRMRYQMWCPEHPELLMFRSTVPRWDPYCEIEDEKGRCCNTELVGKWVQK